MSINSKFIGMPTFIFQSMSGINIEDNCKTLYEEMKLRKSYSYIIYKIDKGVKNVVVESTGDPDKTFEDFRNALKSVKGEGRYAVYDCQNPETRKGKLIFVMWIDEDNIPVKQKMIYSSTKTALKAKLQIELELQCNDDSDLTLENFLDKCKDKYE